MADSRLVASLERDQHEDVLRREWRFERIGWGFVGLLLVAGLVGAFGGGIVASTSIRSANGAVTVEYDRVVRHGASHEIRLRLAPSRTPDTLTVVSVAEAYLAGMEVMRVTPEPLRVRASPGRVEYQLLRLEPDRPMTVVFALDGGTTGTARATLGVGSDTLVFRQFVVP
jgi:hypothetical protein